MAYKFSVDSSSQVSERPMMEKVVFRFPSENVESPSDRWKVCLCDFIVPFWAAFSQLGKHGYISSENRWANYRIPRIGCHRSVLLDGVVRAVFDSLAKTFTKRCNERVSTETFLLMYADRGRVQVVEVTTCKSQSKQSDRSERLINTTLPTAARKSRNDHRNRSSRRGNFEKSKQLCNRNWQAAPNTIKKKQITIKIEAATPNLMEIYLIDWARGPYGRILLEFTFYVLWTEPLRRGP